MEQVGDGVASIAVLNKKGKANTKEPKEEAKKAYVFESPNYAPRPPAGFVLKDKMLELVTQGRIVIDEAINAASANPIFVQVESSMRTRLNKPRGARREYHLSPAHPTNHRRKSLRLLHPKKPLQQTWRGGSWSPDGRNRSERSNHR
ncbi:hypothetical protein H6P81_006341 [Aristolochia fimbriata]|uniref:Uncharacterized protein n=1 Tax=Aristolochia fimbriata TaxID=158543 RepID=A0AAV7F0X9_ARIFI|nr:hypothetical protein H6P81_006341 [Aristolochia fimbriata]